MTTCLSNLSGNSTGNTMDADVGRNGVLCIEEI